MCLCTLVLVRHQLFTRVTFKCWGVKVWNFTPICDYYGTGRTLRWKLSYSVRCRAMCNSEKVFKMWLKIIKDRLKLFLTFARSLTVEKYILQPERISLQLLCKYIGPSTHARRHQKLVLFYQLPFSVIFSFFLKFNFLLVFFFFFFLL